MAERKIRVLFLCTGNSARSQMAEGLLRTLAGDRFEVHSAGLSPGGLHPLTVRVMEERGVDVSGQESKDVSRYLGKVSFTWAITVCDSAQKNCPSLYPFSLNVEHWPFEDPAAFEGIEEEQIAKFREVRDAIEARIKIFLSVASEEAQA